MEEETRIEIRPEQVKLGLELALACRPKSWDDTIGIYSVLVTCASVIFLWYSQHRPLLSVRTVALLLGAEVVQALVMMVTAVGVEYG